MENKDTPAFPMLDMNHVEGQAILQLRYEGLTKREYFAGLAMQGLLAAGDYNQTDMIGVDERMAIAQYAVQHADALLNQISQ